MLGYFLIHIHSVKSSGVMSGVAGFNIFVRRLYIYHSLIISKSLRKEAPLTRFRGASTI